MKPSLCALGLVAAGLLRCGGDRTLVVGEERGEGNIGGTSAGSGGSAGGTPSGGTASGGTPSGGTPSGGTPSGGTATGGTPSGGTAGTTSGSSSGGRNGGGSGGTGGTNDPDSQCISMAREYRDRLMSANICMPGTPDPCTLMMPDDLVCGCPTFVNPARYIDVSRMDYLLAMADRCPRMCPPEECRPASSGVCMAEPSPNPPRPRCYTVP